MYFFFFKYKFRFFSLLLCVSPSVSLCPSPVSDAVGNLSCSGGSWDSILLSWEVPVNPNGQIVFYEITVEVDVQSDTHQAHSPEYTVSGLSPDQTYTLTVAAVNSAGPGDAVNCTASTLSESGSQSQVPSLFVRGGKDDYLIKASHFGIQ